MSGPGALQQSTHAASSGLCPRWGTLVLFLDPHSNDHSGEPAGGCKGGAVPAPQARDERGPRNVAGLHGVAARVETCAKTFRRPCFGCSARAPLEKACWSQATRLGLSLALPRLHSVKKTCLLSSKCLERPAVNLKVGSSSLPGSACYQCSHGCGCGCDGVCGAWK